MQSHEVIIRFQYSKIDVPERAMFWPSEYMFIISRRAEGPRQEILQRLSVTFSFRTVTRKRIAVFSQIFAGTCTMSWGCAIVIDVMFEFFMNFLSK